MHMSGGEPGSTRRGLAQSKRQRGSRRGPRVARMACSAGLLCLALVLALAATACERRGPAEETLRVAVSIPPLLVFAGEMLPDGAEAILLMPPGASPHTYEVKPGDVAALAGADLIVLNGLGVDGSVEQAVRSLGADAPPLLRLSDRLQGTEGQGAGEAAVHEHEHGGHDDHADHDHAGHDHGDLDPHLWLDPLFMQQFIPSLSEALLMHIDDAAARAQVEARSRALAERVKALHARFAERLQPLAGAGFIAEHPAYGRLAARYGLRQVGTIRAVAQVEPTPAVVQDLVKLIESGEARAIFVEPQFPAETAQRLAELTGAPVLRLDPLGEGDWFAMMNENLDALVEGLTPKP